MRYRWGWNKTPSMPDRWTPGGRRGQRCEVLARGALNTALVRFEDGALYTTSRNGLRRGETMRTLKDWSGAERDVVLEAVTDLRIEDLAGDVGAGEKDVQVWGVDIETTGLDETYDEVLEIALRRVTIGVSGDAAWIRGMGEAQAWLQEPSRTIPADITALTGISDADVKGHQIPWEDIRAELGHAPVLLAHNAEFEARWLEPHIGSLQPFFVCSQRMIDWRGRYGLDTLGLGSLCRLHGFWVPGAHRATPDVDAMIALLSARPGEGRPQYWSDVVAATRAKYCRLVAYRSPIRDKDRLRKIGYRWDGDGMRAWWKMVPHEDLYREAMRLQERSSAAPMVIECPIRELYDDGPRDWSVMVAATEHPAYINGRARADGL